VAPSFAEIFKGLDLRTLEGRAEAAKRLREQWDRFLENPEEFEKALEASGLTLDEWKQQMLEVNEVLSEAAIAANRFAEALDDAFVDLEIAGIEDPRSRADAAVAAAAEADERFQGLFGFNLGTAEGRAAAEKFLQGLAVGADDEFKEIILQLLRAIRAIPGGEDAKQPGEVEIVGRAAQGVLETTAQDLAALARTELILEREQLAELRAIRERLAPMISAPSVPRVQAPAFSASLGVPSVSVSSAPSVVFAKESIVINAPPGVVTDQQGFQTFLAGELPRAFIRKVSEGLSAEATFTQLVGGSVVVRG
jgi:hypothetical protein